MDDTLKQSIDVMRARQGAPVGEPENEHGCDGGFRYVTQDDGTIAVEPCRECEAEKRLKRLEQEIRASGIGDRYFGVEWEDLELVEPMPRIRAACERIGEIIDAGESALLHGTPGTGKTQAAVLLVKAAIRAGYTARVENLGRLAMNVRAGYDDRTLPSEKSVVDELSTVSLLVLDDIGAGETDAATVEKRVLYLVTEARQNATLPTIVTTNLDGILLKKHIGQRILNRLSPLTTIGFTHGRNFRRRAGTESSAW